MESDRDQDSAGTARGPARGWRTVVRVVRGSVRWHARSWVLKELQRQRSHPRAGAADPRAIAARVLLAALDRYFEAAFRAAAAGALVLPNGRPPARRMRVCLVIGTLGPGGAERQAKETVTALASRHDADISCLVMFLEQEWQRFFLDDVRGAGVDVRQVHESGDPLALLSQVEHPDASRIARVIRSTIPAELHDIALYAREFLVRQPDVVHLWLDEINTKAGMAALLTGVPRIVLGMRSVNPTHFALFQPYMRAAYRVLLERTQVGALNNSEVGAMSYERWLDVAPGRITVVRNGFDFSGFTDRSSPEATAAYRRSLGIPLDALVVGGVMRLSEEKRPLLWLETAEFVLARLPDVHFLLIGDGVLRSAVESRIAERGLSHRVHVPGYARDTYAAMPAMNLLFLSSSFEGLPNVLIEAQALGVPVVTMPAGGAVETLHHGRTGWVVKDGTAASAGQLISELLSHPTHLAAAAAAAPAFVRERFDVERMLRDTVSMYGRVPARRRRDERSGSGETM